MFKKFMVSLLAGSLLSIQPAFCFTIKDVYKVENASKEEVVKNIDNYITLKKHKIHRKDLQKGYFYFRPRYMGQLLGENDYVAIKVDDSKGETQLFIRNDFSSNRIRQLIVKNLKKSDYKCIDIDDDHLEEPYSEDVSNFIAGYSITNALFESFKEIDINDFEYSDDKNLVDNIELKVIKKIFNSNLNDKFAGYTFNIKNKNTIPVVIIDIKTYNTYDEKEAFKEVRKVTTWEHMTISAISGALAIPTFGISLALLPVAVGFVAKENLPVKNEIEKFLQEKAKTNYLKENQSTDIRIISTKSDSIITKRPYIQVNFAIPETKKIFTVDTRNEKGNKKWEDLL